MAQPPGECAGVEWTVDLGAQFCERCGRDRDSFASSRNAYRDCPACGAACCADCWNLVDGACLVCAPFRLHAETTPPRIVIAPADLAAPTRVADPYADLRGGGPTPGGWDGSEGTARQRPGDVAAAGAAPRPVAPDAWRAATAAGLPSAPRRRRRRAGRIGLAAGAAWVVVAALAVVALGASPRAAPAAAATVAPSGPGLPIPFAAPRSR